MAKNTTAAIKSCLRQTEPHQPMTSWLGPPNLHSVSRLSGPWAEWLPDPSCSFSRRILPQLHESQPSSDFCRQDYILLSRHCSCSSEVGVSLHLQVKKESRAEDDDTTCPFPMTSLSISTKPRCDMLFPRHPGCIQWTQTKSLLV